MEIKKRKLLFFFLVEVRERGKKKKKFGEELSGLGLELFWTSPTLCPKAGNLPLLCLSKQGVSSKNASLPKAVNTPKEPMSLFIKTSYSHHFSSTAMAMCSSFSALSFQPALEGYPFTLSLQNLYFLSLSRLCLHKRLMLHLKVFLFYWFLYLLIICCFLN